MNAPLFASPDAIAGFEQHLATRTIGKRIHFYNETQSTNDLALESARVGGAHGTVFVADAQHAGRGRRGRNWDCPPGMGLLLSVLIRPENIPPEAAGWIPLAAGLSCAEALGPLSGLATTLAVKWPNDIVLPCIVEPGWKKLGGVLCESALPALSGGAADSSASRGYAVIGIGLNLNQTSGMLPETEKAPATSLRIETGNPVDRQRVLQAVLKRLEFNLERLENKVSRSALKESLEVAMREWLPPWRVLHFRHPALPTTPDGADNLRSGSFEGLDDYGRIRIREIDGVTAYADAEIVRIDRC